MRAVSALSADYFYFCSCQRRYGKGCEHIVHTLNNGFARSPRLGYRVEADDGELCRCLEAVHIGGTDLVAVGWRASARARDAHVVTVPALDAYVAPVASHVWQQVGGRVMDFVEQLFGHALRRDQPARARRLGDGETAVFMAFGNGIANVRPIRDILPVGVQAARRLAAAFKNVTSQAARRKQVIVGDRPVEGVHQRTQRHRRIHAAPGDHDLGASIQRGLDRQGAQVGIGRQHLGWQGRAALKLLYRRLSRAQRCELRHHVVAGDHGDVDIDAQLRRQGAQGVGAALRIDAASVADHANALLHDIHQHAAHGHIHKVRGVTHGWVLETRTRQDRHGEFG